VRIIGHSLGGIIGRQVCIERPELVSQLVYLGTPIRAVHAHPAVMAAATVLGTARGVMRGDPCLTPGCECESIVESKVPLPKSVRHAAIYTRRDGVVDWHDARERDPRLNHEVGGTHIGLVYNPRAYKALGRLLAEVNL
jgi:pimeloyl-ACP methyl ester carboxylesterase